jgi:hypothetical protein
MLLMKRGGRVVYMGPLGRNSQLLINYFESIRGVPRIKEGYNPAMWMLEATSTTVEAELKVDFADIYAQSSLFRYLACNFESRLRFNPSHETVT